jgi:5-formaminoimidazole-4-carboxamide-1-beta-D-ribofuranosyl 5'-monophosphate synthetase
MNPTRKDVDNDKYWSFNNLESKVNMFSAETPSIQYLTAKLEENEMLFIPSFFFVQHRTVSKIENNLVFNFFGNSRVLNTLFKVLYDDNIDDEDSIFD